MKYGYIRVSSKQQNLARQLEIMKKEEIPENHIFADKASGKNMQREKLEKLLGAVREGDKIVVADITRLGRNMCDIVNLIDKLDKQKIHVVSIKEGMDTSTATGKMIIQIFGAFSEMERENIRERQRQGIEIAKREGRIKGRPKAKCDNFMGVYRQYLQQDISIEQAVKLLECSKSTFYRRIREYKDSEIIDF